jgi:uncharacterized repeat protein (TIGR03847 family)
MPIEPIELDPVSKLTVDAIGKPGARVFYLQGCQPDQEVTLLIEKPQVIALAEGIQRLMEEIAVEYPQRKVLTGSFEEVAMRIHPPVDPIFRVGDIGLGYDGARDLLCVVAREILLEEAEEGSGQEARFWCTRPQAAALQLWCLELTRRGRPICPQCSQPMEPEGHFCPKKNGHK